MDTREAGRRGGLAHAKKYEAAAGVRAMSLDEVEKKLPKMTDVDSVKRCIELLVRWAVAGLIPGTTAGAVVRGCEVWLRLHDSEIDRRTLADAFKHIAQLEKELAQAKKRLAEAEAS
ncbi:MAG TPA: hypothetical protein VN803_01050 [Gemmatimonadales bacterium]|nr:hypothetical protein [Gemmatimonadales bacterium]